MERLIVHLVKWLSCRMAILWNGYLVEWLSCGMGILARSSSSSILRAGRDARSTRVILVTLLFEIP